MAEHPCITLITEGPRGEQGKGGQRLPVGNVGVGERDPPLFGGSKMMSDRGVDAFELQPFLDYAPKPNGKPTSENKAIDRFLLAPTEGDKGHSLVIHVCPICPLSTFYFGRPTKRRTSLWERDWLV